MARRVPRLLAISDRRRLPEGGLEGWLRALAAARIEGAQLREKEGDDREVFELACSARGAFPRPGLLLVNGRLDIALAAGADGVHLPADGVPIAALRRRFGAGVLIGRSTHDPEEVAAAAREGADYVTFGPVYPTPSKAAYGPPPGLGGLRRAAGCGLPVLALGGVTLERLAEVAAAGAAGAGGIGMFLDADRLSDLARRARECFGAVAA